VTPDGPGPRCGATWTYAFWAEGWAGAIPCTRSQAVADGSRLVHPPLPQLRPVLPMNPLMVPYAALLYSQGNSKTPPRRGVAAPRPRRRRRMDLTAPIVLVVIVLCIVFGR